MNTIILKIDDDGMETVESVEFRLRVALENIGDVFGYEWMSELYKDNNIENVKIWGYRYLNVFECNVCTCAYFEIANRVFKYYFNDNEIVEFSK